MIALGAGRSCGMLARSHFSRKILGWLDIYALLKDPDSSFFLPVDPVRMSWSGVYATHYHY